MAPKKTTLKILPMTMTQTHHTCSDEEPAKIAEEVVDLEKELDILKIVGPDLLKKVTNEIFRSGLQSCDGHVLISSYFQKQFRNGNALHLKFPNLSERCCLAII